MTALSACLTRITKRSKAVEYKITSKKRKLVPNCSTRTLQRDPIVISVQPKCSFILKPLRFTVKSTIKSEGNMGHTTSGFSTTRMYFRTLASVISSAYPTKGCSNTICKHVVRSYVREALLCQKSASLTQLGIMLPFPYPQLHGRIGYLIIIFYIYLHVCRYTIQIVIIDRVFLYNLLCLSPINEYQTKIMIYRL